jgi:hypothetical protein
MTNIFLSYVIDFFVPCLMVVGPVLAIQFLIQDTPLNDMLCCKKRQSCVIDERTIRRFECFDTQIRKKYHTHMSDWYECFTVEDNISQVNLNKKHCVSTKIINKSIIKASVGGADPVRGEASPTNKDRIEQELMHDNWVIDK